MVKVSIGAAVVTATLLWAASPAGGAGPLAWIALVPVATVVLSASGTRARLAVPLAYALYLELLLVPALPFGIASGQWGDATVPVMVGDSPVLAVALLAVPLFGALLYLIRGAVGRGAARPAAVDGRRGARAGGGVDGARSPAREARARRVVGPLFLSQVDPPASDLAALGGPWLVTLAIVAVNYGLALALVRRRPAPALVPAVAVAAALAISAAAEDEPSGPPSPSPRSSPGTTPRRRRRSRGGCATGTPGSSIWQRAI